MPAANPRKSKLRRIDQRLLLKEVHIRTIPTHRAEIIMVLLWVRRLERNPELRSEMK
jgi:hypothetical protein